MIACREAGHADDAEHRDADRRDGVRIEHFQLFDVGGDERDEVAAVTAFQLGRSQAAERPEHLVADEGQQFERDIVVGRLFGIPKHAAQEREHQNADEHGADRGERAFQPCRRQQTEAAEDGDEGGTEITRHAHGDGRQHDGQHRLHQNDKPPDDLERTAFFGRIHALTSPRFSSCFCALYRRL